MTADQIVTNEILDMFNELKQRRDKNQTSVQEELAKDPKFAKRLYIMSGFKATGCN